MVGVWDAGACARIPHANQVNVVMGRGAAAPHHDENGVAPMTIKKILHVTMGKMLE